MTARPRNGFVGVGNMGRPMSPNLAAAGFAAVSEAMIVGERFGLEPSKMVDIMNNSTGRNFMTDLVMKPHVIDDAFATGFTLALLAKDVGIAEDLAADLNLSVPLLSRTVERWRDVAPPGADNTEAFTAWRTLASEPEQ